MDLNFDTDLHYIVYKTDDSTMDLKAVEIVSDTPFDLPLGKSRDYRCMVNKHLELAHGSRQEDSISDDVA